LELIRRTIFTKEELDVPADYFREFGENNPKEIQLIGLKHINLKQASEEIRKQISQNEVVVVPTEVDEQVHHDLADVDFVQLHNHTQFSVLQSTISVADLVKAAVQNKMPAVAMTDHANLMGAFHFVRDILYHNKSAQAKNKQAEENAETPTETIIKPIVGCEFYVCDDLRDKSRKENGYQIVF
jgi:DNA polymerase-3 subunit alpha